MSARVKHVGRLPSTGAKVKDAKNAASGDAAYNAPRLTDVGRVPPRGGSPEGAKEGGELPRGWQWKTIPDLVSDDGVFIDGDWIESKDLADDGIRYLTSGNVGEGVYKEQGQGFVSEATFAALNCVDVLPGDILVSRLNLPIGRSCIVPSLSSRIVTCVDNVIVRPDRNFDRHFIVYMLSSKSHFANMENLSRGTTVQRISRSALGRVRFAVPPEAEPCPCSL